MGSQFINKRIKILLIVCFIMVISKSVVLIQNCLIVSQDGCSQCQSQYIINNLTVPISCKLFSSVKYQLSTTSAICLQVNHYFNSTECVPNIDLSLNYCKEVSATDKNNCSVCNDGYYLKDNRICLSCIKQIDNCLQCQSCVSTATCNVTCKTCLPNYFLFVDPLTQSKICRSCSVYGCKRCELTQAQSNSIRCLQCEKGQTLNNGTCYSCPDGFFLNSTTFECQACPQNCFYCPIGICTWCNQTYVLNNQICEPINSTVNLTPQSAFQILSKGFPLQQQIIFNNEVQLMSSCQSQLSNKYSCLCNASFNVVSSLCYNIPTQMATFNLSSVFGGTIIDGNKFLENADVVRLMAQLPDFDQLTINIESVLGSQIYFTEEKIASLLQVYTQMLRRQSLITKHPASSKNRLLMTEDQVISQLFNLVSSSFSQTFSLTETTVIYGNGYYMKYYPKGANITDTDSTFITVQGRNESDFLFLFVYFDGRNGTTSLTGNIYAYSPLPAYYLNVNIQQVQYPSSQSVVYQYYENNVLNAGINVTNPSPTILSFSISTSTSLTTVSYKVSYSQSQAVNINQLYKSQRIEFIFYQPAFIYVLIFLLAYLFLIPCCSFVDFIDGNKSLRRKRVDTQDFSVSDEAKQNKRRNDQQSSQTTIQIRVNYKDFFPIYNICNTPRPRRILKLCLFLLNTQHSITFLTLIYFNLAPGHPVVAVVLGVPAYFCTIIMGYICGCFTLLKIPLWVKYSINIIAIGYWILWIALMPRFQSQQYQPYVYIFAIVFFVIDMLIDMLEMFMVYFTIKQSERQMKMFQCLAAWLSKRGYYEYDKLARELND